MIALGIDPGLSGGIVALEESGPSVVVLAQIMLDDLDRAWWTPALMADTLRELPRPDRVALEMAQAARVGKRSGADGKKSGPDGKKIGGAGKESDGPGKIGHGTLGIGQRWGYLHAVCCLLWPGASIWTPAASSWMASALRDQPGEGKARAVALVSSVLPGLDLTPGRRRKPHDGLADAGALAWWALRRTR